MVKRNYFWLLIIIVLAGLLRFYKLSVNPPALTWDEAAWGYNAYSLGIDGKDEFGRFLPLDYLESFGDFKPPVYAYLAILPVKIFDLNEFAVRMPSAFLGTLTVLIVYFLVRELFIRSRSTQMVKQIDADKLSLASALFLTISPWHVNLSRAAFEANVAQFFIVTGVWLFLLSIRRNAWLLILSVISFVVSLYTFNTARVVTPLLVLMLGIGFYKQLLQNKKMVLIAVLVGIIFSLPYAKFALTPQVKLRYHEVNIFSDLSIIETSNKEMENDNNAWWSRLLHNRRWGYARSYARHYLDHFNPSFLFIKGDGNPKFSTQDVGQLYLWNLPFLIIGALYLFRRKEGYWWIVPAWLLIGIVPAATARETPHALRILTTLPTWQIVTAYGALGFLGWLGNLGVRRIFKSLVCVFGFLLLVFNLIYYLHGYYVHYPIEYSGEWQYGYKEAINYINDVESQYNKIVFTKALGRPYIYVLFHTRANPNLFRQSASVERETFGFVHVNGFGKYVFTKDLSSIKSDGQKTLYIDVPDKVPEQAKKLVEFNLLNGNPVLVAYE